jgi:hypothetical protein
MGGFGLIFTAEMAYFVPFLGYDEYAQENDNCSNVFDLLRPIVSCGEERAVCPDRVAIEL